MGAYLSKPVTKTEPEEGNGNRLEYGASSMQGWRVTQEDAHNCVIDFDDKSSLFAVYDGHGGSEVALYLSQHLPTLLRSTSAYKEGKWKEALVEAYLEIDGSMKKPEVLKEIVRLSKWADKTDDDEDGFVEDNVAELYEEATMPIEMLVAKYQDGQKSILEKLMAGKLQGLGERPGSSKSLRATDDSARGSSSSSNSNKSQPINEDSSEVSNQKEKGSDEVSSAQLISDENIDEDVMDVSISHASSNGDAETCGNDSNPMILEGKDELINVKKCTKSNGEVEHDNTEKVEPMCDPLSVEANEKETKKPEVNGLENGTNEGETPEKKDENEEDLQPSSNIREESILVISKKRRGKTHSPPILQLLPKESESSSPEKRTSPRKVNTEMIYKEFLSNNSGESSSDEEEEDEDDPTTLGTVDSDSDEEVSDEDSSDDEDADVEEEDEDESEDDVMLKDYQEPAYDSGATAVTAFLKWEGDKLHCWVANAGDSRCIVSRSGKALEMSEDHKPEDEREALRIVAAGGKVTSEGRVNGGLNLSRAIGDHSYKTNTKLALQEQMITALPDVEYAELDPTTDKFIVLACDGIWNSMTSQQVIEFVSVRIADPAKKLSTICEELFNTCLAADTAGDGTGCDNMTAIIIRITGENEIPPPPSDKFEICAEVEKNEAVKSIFPLEDMTEVESKVTGGLKRALNGSPDREDVKRLKIDNSLEEQTLPSSSN